MKYFETHFEEYLNTENQHPFHPKLEKYYKKFPNDITRLKNLIFYGPSGSGKYTQMLKSIQKYSPTHLKYERKMYVSFNKQTYCFKVSDIHYEVDMSLLGCNSRQFWNDIYQQIADSILTKPTKTGIIVCKNFQEISSELLEYFYSYTQQNINSSARVVFILMTSQISFIPNRLVQCCEMIRVPKPVKSVLQKYLKSVVSEKGISVEQAQYLCNLKMMHHYSYIECSLSNPHLIMSRKLIMAMKNEHIDFIQLRELIYDLFIYNVDIPECAWYILTTLFQEQCLRPEQLTDAVLITYQFFKLFNNNYRPIYHVEYYILSLIKLMYENKLNKQM